ncbi:MAG: hypothetical protein JKY45_04090 [Emcibacter sp.]|nr:hypothetical protein [Emcibacter sp.]
MAVTPQDMRKYNKAYETMRRHRHGFHNPQNELVDELKEKYRSEYEKEEDVGLSAEQRYQKYLKNVEIVNAEIIDDFEQHELWDEIQDNQYLPFKRSIERMGYKQAIRKFSWFITNTHKTDLKKPRMKKAHSLNTFKREYDFLETLEAYIRGIFNKRKLKYITEDEIKGDVDYIDRHDWIFGDGTYTEKEQYKRKVIEISIGRPDTPTIRKKMAYKASKQFADKIQHYEACFAYHLELKGIKQSNLIASVLAKLMSGEMVRLLAKAKKDKPDRFEEKHASDKSMVNKVATVLTYFEENGISPSKVEACFKAIGGEKAIIDAQRS